MEGIWEDVESFSGIFFVVFFFFSRALQKCNFFIDLVQLLLLFARSHGTPFEAPSLSEARARASTRS